MTVAFVTDIYITNMKKNNKMSNVSISL